MKQRRRGVLGVNAWIVVSLLSLVGWPSRPYAHAAESLAFGPIGPVTIEDIAYSLAYSGRETRSSEHHYLSTAPSSRGWRPP